MDFPNAVQAQRPYSCVLATNMVNNIQQHCQLGQVQTSRHACRHMHIHDGTPTCLGCITDHNAQQNAQHSAVMSTWCSANFVAMHVCPCACTVTPTAWNLRVPGSTREPPGISALIPRQELSVTRIWRTTYLPSRLYRDHSTVQHCQPTLIQG